MNVFTIKGVLIAQNGQFPDKELLALKKIYETPDAVYIENALTDLFYDNLGSRQIAIESLEFPDTQGKSLKHKPFVITCETDTVNTLILT